MIATFLWSGQFGQQLLLGVNGVRPTQHLQRVAQDILVPAGGIDDLRHILDGHLALDRFDLILRSLPHASRYCSIRSEPVFLLNESPARFNSTMTLKLWV